MYQKFQIKCSRLFSKPKKCYEKNQKNSKCFNYHKQNLNLLKIIPALKNGGISFQSKFQISVVIIF